MQQIGICGCVVRYVMCVLGCGCGCGCEGDCLSLWAGTGVINLIVFVWLCNSVILLNIMGVFGCNYVCGKV